MEEDSGLKIDRCKKFQDNLCPNMDRPEMEKTMRYVSEKEPSKSARGFEGGRKENRSPRCDYIYKSQKGDYYNFDQKL